MGARQQRMGLERERKGRGLHEPASPDPPELFGEQLAPGGRDMLDHAGAVDEVELGVREGKPLDGIGLDEWAGISGPCLQVDARDVQARLEPSQSSAPQPRSSTRPSCDRAVPAKNAA